MGKVTSDKVEINNEPISKEVEELLKNENMSVQNLMLFILKSQEKIIQLLELFKRR